MSKRRFNPFGVFTGGFVPEWLLQRPEISPGAKLVYARLTRYAGQNGVAYPKVETLGNEVGLSKRQTRRYIDALENSGLIEVDRSSCSKGGSGRYYFLMHPWIEDTLNVEAAPDTSVRTPPDTSVRTLRTHVSGLKESHRRESSEESHGVASAPAPAARVGPQPKGMTLTPAPGSNSTREPSRPDDHAFADGLTQEAVDAFAAKKAAEAQKKREAKSKRDRAKVQKAMNLKGGPKNYGTSKLGKAIENVWRTEMGTAFPDLPVADWDAKEFSIAKKLVTKYSGSDTVAAIKYVVRSWESISERYFKGKGDIPTMGLILNLHERLVPVASQWEKHSEVIEEWDAFFRENPYGDPPSDLEERYREARKVLEKMGLA